MFFKMKDMHIIESLKIRETKAKLIKVFILFVYLPLGVSVALLTPDNILDYPWPRAYTNLMASWLPYVSEVGRWTKDPATQFIAAVMNLVAMLCSFSMIYSTKHYLKENIKWLSNLPTKKLIALLFVIPFICIGGFFFLLFLVPVSHPPKWRDRIMLDSKIGMGIDGSLHIGAGWFCLAIGLIVVISFFVLVMRRFVTKRASLLTYFHDY